MIRSHKQIIFYPVKGKAIDLINYGDLLVDLPTLTWEGATQTDEIINAASPLITPRGNLVGTLSFTRLISFIDRLEAEEFGDRHALQMMLARKGELAIINRSGTMSSPDRLGAVIQTCRALPMSLDNYLGNDQSWIAMDYVVQLTILSTQI